MNQESTLTRRLSDAQNQHAAIATTTYRLYTEDKPGLFDLVARYFDGATLWYGQGLDHGHVEAARIIEVVGTLSDLQRIVDLAQDIRTRGDQTCVLVTWHRSTTFRVIEPPRN